MTGVEYGTIAGIDKPVSRLAAGTVMISTANAAYSFGLLDTLLEAGVNTFDTGHVYGGGDNERAFGQWVNARGNREKVVLIAKGAHHNEDRRRVTDFDIKSDLFDSLARFRLDYVDLYLLHRDDPNVPVGPIVEALNEHVAAGRIRAFGGSNWSHERVREANEYAAKNGLIPFAASSPHYSLAVQINEPWENCVSITGPEQKAAVEWYRRQNMPLVPWSSVAAGFFSGRFSREQYGDPENGTDMMCAHSYIREDNFQRLDRAQELAAEKGVTATQLALAWVMSQGLNVFPLVGARNEQEVAWNVEAAALRLTPEEVAWLNLERDDR